jgi:hypothetical protein
VIFVVALFCGVPSLSAWGSDGHRMIGEMAWHFLTPGAAREVEALLVEGTYDNLADVGYWADAHARSFDEYDWAITRHYIPTDPQAADIDLARDCKDGNCVVAEIARLTVLVGDHSLPIEERRDHFRFLVHFIEDVHQPLHIVHPDGEGGNRTRVTLFGRRTNLHSVWDSGLIRHRIERYQGSTDSGRVRVPWKNWAYELRREISQNDFKAWTVSLDPLDWAQEGMAPSRELAFEVDDELGEEYYRKAIPVVDLRLRQAAVRLAATLNEIFADSE